MSEELRVARRAGGVGAATMLSRILGLVREQVMAGFFGASLATDAFNVAFRFPNLLRDLFAEGAMSSAFVPTFTEVRRRDGDDEAFAFGRQIMLYLAVILGAVCVVAALLAPQLVGAFAPGFSRTPGKAELTVLLTRVMLPFLPLVALTAAVAGMLNARDRFTVPALAPAVLNLAMVVVGVALIPACKALGQPPILAMAVGVVAGGVLQLGCQLPQLHRLGFRMRLEALRAHPGVRRIATMMAPATLGLAATQINLLVSTIIASLLPQGSVSWLWYAFRLMQLPIGVFGVAIATVSLPALSRAAVERDLDALKTTFSAALRLVFFLTIPAAAWLAVMARPVIELVYQHGRFGPIDTQQTSGALVAYCVGLPAFAAVGVLTRTFYALGDTRTPLQASLVSVALNLALNLLFIGPLRFLGLEHHGLALATSATSIVSLAQLWLYLRRRVGALEGRRALNTVLRVGAASLCGAAAVIGTTWIRHGIGGLAGELLSVVLGLLVGVAVVIAAMKLLRVEELGTLEALWAGLFRRVLGR